MKRAAAIFNITLVLVGTFNSAAIAQKSKDGGKQERNCSGLVYTVKEVSRRAKLKLPGPQVDITEEAVKQGVRGRVSVKAVLCSTGKVTDIEVIKGLPYGLTEKVIDAVRKVKFTPAEKDGQVVSQWVTFDYDFNTEHR
ncbi:MAG TPA: energy transducer TonB [Nitrososphaera sp.]|jgi:TonB family protein|nr:energy transducer TonB [Nitrososphaera sp.]